MTEQDTTPVAESNGMPHVVHQGRYRLYEKPDGGLHIVYQRDDKTEPDHIDLPGALVKMAQMAGEGKLSMPDMLRELMAMRRNMGGELSIPRQAWANSGRYGHYRS